VKGDAKSASQMLQRALDDKKLKPLQRAKLLPARIEITLARGQIDVAEDSARELDAISDTYGCPCFKASAHLGVGSAALARGDADSAIASLREAWSAWNDLGFPYEAALSRARLAEAYKETGNYEEAKLSAESALSVFKSLGAAPEVERVSEWISSTSGE